MPVEATALSIVRANIYFSKYSEYRFIYNGNKRYTCIRNVSQTEVLTHCFPRFLSRLNPRNFLRIERSIFLDCIF